MSTIYLSCTIDFDDPGGDDPIGGFGFTELPPGEYPAPVAGSYARVTYDSSAATAGIPFTDSDVTGGYELSGYSYAGSTVFTAESGPVFGVYTYGATVLLRIFPPPGLGGGVRSRLPPHRVLSTSSVAVPVTSCITDQPTYLISQFRPCSIHRKRTTSP